MNYHIEVDPLLNPRWIERYVWKVGKGGSVDSVGRGYSVTLRGGIWAARRRARRHYRNYSRGHFYESYEPKA